MNPMLSARKDFFLGEECSTDSQAYNNEPTYGSDDKLSRFERKGKSSRSLNNYFVKSNPLQNMSRDRPTILTVNLHLLSTAIIPAPANERGVKVEGGRHKRC